MKHFTILNFKFHPCWAIIFLTSTSHVDLNSLTGIQDKTLGPICLQLITSAPHHHSRALLGSALAQANLNAFNLRLISLKSNSLFRSHSNLLFWNSSFFCWNIKFLSSKAPFRSQDQFDLICMHNRLIFLLISHFSLIWP